MRAPTLDPCETFRLHLHNNPVACFEYCVTPEEIQILLDKMSALPLIGFTKKERTIITMSVRSNNVDSYLARATKLHS